MTYAFIPYLSYIQQFLLGSGGSEDPGLFLLLRSLLKLQRHQACLTTAVESLSLLLLADSQDGSEPWTVAVREVVTVIDRCLTDGRDELLKCSDTRLLKQLSACVLKTMDTVHGMNPLYSMPTCLLWKIFYVVISRYDMLMKVSKEITILILYTITSCMQ